MRLALTLCLAFLVIPGAIAQNSVAENKALRELETFTTLQARTDPHFDKAETELLPSITTIVRTNPPEEWLPIVRRLYFGISERLHRVERELVAAEERDAWVRLPHNTPGDVVWKYYEQRLTEISKVMETGRWGPRAQALHALEAAKLYYPDDQPFLAYRQARVPLATAYEMGRISRTEYDERWAKAGAELMANRRAADQARADMELAVTIEGERARRAYEDRVIRSSPTTCTSQVTLGRLVTTCR